MGTLEDFPLSRIRLRWFASVVVMTAALSSGCHTESWLLDNEPVIAHDAHKPKLDPSCSVIGVTALPMWDKAVHFVPDTTHGGKPVPALIGRIALLDLKGSGKGVPAMGELQIDFYDHTPLRKGGDPVRLPGCNYQSEHLELFLKEDAFTGWGYTIMLPWPGYNPEVREVYLEGRFIPSNGEPPVHITGTRLAIDHSAAVDKGVWKVIRNETFSPR